MNTCVQIYCGSGCIGTDCQTKSAILNQCRYYILLYSKLCMNASNHNQFDICIVTRVDSNRMRGFCKSFKFIKIFKSTWPNGLWHWISIRTGQKFSGSNLAGYLVHIIIFIFSLPSRPFLTARRSPFK